MSREIGEALRDKPDRLTVVLRSTVQTRQEFEARLSKQLGKVAYGYVLWKWAFRDEDRALFRKMETEPVDSETVIAMARICWVMAAAARCLAPSPEGRFSPPDLGVR